MTLSTGPILDTTRHYHPLYRISSLNTRKRPHKGDLFRQADGPEQTVPGRSTIGTPVHVSSMNRDG